MSNLYFRSFFLGCSALAFVFFLIDSAHAATLHVDQGGGGDCTTIAACTGRLRAGDTLYIHAGTYSEGRIVLTGQGLSGGSWSNLTTISGAPGEARPLLRSTMFDCTDCAYTTFEQLTMDGEWNFNIALLIIGSHHIRMKDMEMKNYTEQGAIGCDEGGGGCEAFEHLGAPYCDGRQPTEHVPFECLREPTRADLYWLLPRLVSDAR